MNPSASGWIKKLLTEVGRKHPFLNCKQEVFYDALRNCGFIYGSNLNVIAGVVDKKDLTQEELCKVNFCLAFLYIYHKFKPQIAFEDSVIGFYNSINDSKPSFFKEFLNKNTSVDQLEKIIYKRIHIDANILTKNFNYFIINALLFVDILAYKKYLETNTVSIDYLKRIEISIGSISLDVLNSKETKNQYDESLIKLFESSLRYRDYANVNYNASVSNLKTTLEKYYILDLACMATWTDTKIDFKEDHFLKKLATDLSLKPFITEKSIDSINTFYTTYKDNIALLSSKNIVQNFYDNSSKMVAKLISRNKKRLFQELKDSKELMILLTQSTVRDLTKDEQKKVQEQLLDIFKSIPSLAIFILPGGAILLPLVVKFIPKLLPSAFDENRIEE